MTKIRLSRSRTLIALLGGLIASGLVIGAVAVGAAPSVPAGYTRSCGEADPARPAVQTTLDPLPKAVTGRVDFYAAAYDPHTGQVLRAVSLGDPDHLHPMASSFKPLVVRAIYADIDAGRFTPATVFATTPGNHSLGPAPDGLNPLSKLTDIAINGSNNTAADILFMAYGTERLAQQIHARSPCTSVMITTKGWWTAQAGLAPQVLGENAPKGAAHYAQLPFGVRVQRAAALVAASQKVRSGPLESALDRVFTGPTYSPATELDLQNTTTPRAYADLVYATLSGDGLSPGSRAAFRTTLSTGCCRPDKPLLQTTYWGAKGGITWRVLNLTGSLELPDGQRLAYVYMNDLSATTDAGALRRTVPQVVAWIERQLLDLSRTAPQP